MPSSIAAVLLLLSFALRPLSSALQPRRILHQPFLPLVSSPPSPPPAPSLPFTSSTPENSPFFRSYPSPPSPPSPSSLATFPANISSLSVPRPAKPNTASNKLIITAVAAVVAAVAVVSLAVFLHLRKRGGSSAFSESKTQRSDNCSTVSFNQAPSTHHIPKLQRPSQTSAEFLYLGTLVNSHAPGGAAAFHGSSNASNTRKFDSPELRPLPPLIIQQSLRPNNAEVVSSKDDESEEFYSPKGSINGKESSIGTGSASRRAFAAIEVENFNGSTSNSSSTYSSSVSGSGSASPVRSVSSNLSPVNNTSPINSMPKSPDLIEIQTIAQLPEQTLSPPPETQCSLLRESASPSPPCSCSPERYSRRSEESSPNASDQDVESTVRSNSSIQHNTTVFPIPPEIRGLTVSESAPPLPLRSPSPDRFLTRDESSHMNSNVADQIVESPVRISSPTQHNSTLLPVPILPEMEASVLPESASSIERCLRRDEVSSPRNSDVWDQNVESPVRISSPTQHMSTVLPVPGPPEMEALVLLESESSIERRLRRVLLESASSIERCLRRDEESSRRNSHVPHQNVESPAPISSPTQHNSTVLPVPTLPEMESLVLPESASFIERCLRRDEESSPRNSDVWDQNMESPVTISSPTQHNSTVRPPTETEASVLPESASSTERCLRREEQSSPRNSDVSDQNVESPVTISSPVKLNSTDIPVPEALEMPAFIFPESASSPTPIPSSPERCSMRSEESSPRSSNVSDQNVESLVSAAQHNSTIISPPPEILLPPFSSSPERYLKSEESSPRDPNDLDQNMESPVRISSPAQLNSTEIPTSPELNGLVIPESTSSSGSSSPERYSGEKEELLPRASDASDQDIERPVSSSVQEPAIVIATHSEKEGLVLSSPRISNASDQNDASPARISNVSDQHVASPVRTSNASDQYSTGSEGSPSMILNDSDQNVESPTRNNSLEQHNAATIPPPAPPVSVTPPPLLSVPPPPPPPPPMSKAWHSPRTPTPPRKQGTEPPVLKNPLKPIAFESSPLISPMQLPSNEDKESPSEYSSKNEESPPKPKLKPLHWDKVRASSDREMVWDQLKCSSFELNEEMIETLFVVNTPKPNPKETTRWQVLPSAGQDNGDRVLDPKKAQNIAILLKALHVTVDEVCEGLLEGNADILGTELLESLLKMAPTKEEERKLKEYKDDSPIKLGPAERFLKAVVDVPHAFRRVEVMLYISNFESEVEYLKKSFATLEAACEELRTSRMFLKLLEAVLKTGNRMNVGTNRGDAHAFKLDTLLKLVDVKGADGKTTLLHFVVQEIIRSEGARLSGEGPQDKSDDAKCRKLGLQVVSALSSELSNVKKAAVMDAEMLSTDVSKLSKGIADVREVIKLNEDNSYNKFSDNIQNFIERAEEEICRTQAQESLALSLVKEITEYFHGNSVLEEAHPFRIFLVVRDFLTVLDRVCKEVGLINERTMVSSAHKFPVPVNPMLQQVSAVFHKQQHTSSDDESLPLNV